MSMPSERITEAELSRSRKARQIAANWLQAEETRLKLAGLDPALEGDGLSSGTMRPSKYGRPTALDRVKEARISGLEIKEFSKGLGDEPSTSKPTQVNPATLVEQKSLIIRALAPSHSPEQIEQYLQRLGPYLDVAAMAGADPTAQSLLYSRIMTGNAQQGVTVKDIIEVVGMVNQLKGPQQPQSSDVGQIANAMATALKTGAELASSKNSGGSSDPLATLNAIFPLVEKMTEGQRLVFENQLTTLREELRSRDPSEFVETMKRYSDLFGWSRKPDSEQVQIHRIENDRIANQQAFELSKTKWEKEWELKTEDRKQKAQAELLGGITSTIGKALESPVVRELGKSVGTKIGVKENPISAAQTRAAQNQLENPTQVPYSFTCAQCQTRHTFTALQLTKISEAGGKWACDKCGAPYELGKQP